MELLGVLAAVLSSGLGGSSIGATRYVVGAIDPVALGMFRFGIGCLLLLPIVLLQGGSWPGRTDRPGVVGLGLLFFGLLPILFHASLALTTAARGALALSTLPRLTMLTAAFLGVERLSRRTSIGVFVAMTGVATALVLGLADAPEKAWQGDLLMVGAAFCTALDNVWSKPFIRRSSLGDAGPDRQRPPLWPRAVDRDALPRGLRGCADVLALGLCLAMPPPPEWPSRSRPTRSWLPS